MQKLIHKNFEIYKIEDAPKLGDYTAKFFHIKNQYTNNTFFYTVKISGTVQAIEQINNEKRFIDAALPYVTNDLDKKIERNDHSILITTYTQEEKKKSGIFYTPEEVIRFIFDILNIWKQKEDKETGRWSSRRHFPSVIDPAVGEGAFLKIACETGFTQPDWVFGLDIDENAVKKWREINLLEEFGGKNKDLEAHFFHQNGLEPIKWDQHKGKYKYKLKQIDIQNQQFDAVVGNPPYGGLGIYEDMRLLQESISGSEKTQYVKTQVLDTLFDEQEVRQIKVTETNHKKINISQERLIELKELSKALITYEIWKDSKLWIRRIDHDININGVNFNLKYVLGKKEIERLKSFPVEILFLERFIQLTKPGGWIAIVIPDGILTNSNSDYVREYVSKKAKIETIISLPRNTFKNAGTNAKTSILFLRKLKENEKPDINYPVFLASIESVNSYNFQKITDAYQKFYNKKEKNMDKSQLVQTTPDQNDREAVMVRVDKTLRELMDEKPSSRWNVYYWHPKFDNLFANFKTNPLNNYIVDIQGGGGGSHFSAFLGDKWDSIEKYAAYLHISSITNTGINWVNAKCVNKATYERLKTKQLKTDDILLSNKGTVGKSVVVYKDFPRTIVGDTRVIRIKGINPYYLCVYFKSFYGSMLSEKYKGGVASEGTTVEQIKEFPIPEISPSVQINIERVYKKMSIYHDKAMEAKKNGNNEEYRKNLEIAEKMLKELISRTEAVIRGEREDIV